MTGLYRCAFLVSLLISTSVFSVHGFMNRDSSFQTCRAHMSSRKELLMRAQTPNDRDDSDQEEEFSLFGRSDPMCEDALQTSNSDGNNRLDAPPNANTNHANYLDDLTPPPINWRRDSILFSENPATKRNNNAPLEVWRKCQKYLPPVATGVWPWRDVEITERNPLGAIYNMLFVRIPTMGICAIYIKNLWEGHPLIMDIGQGPFEMSPFVVISVLALILA